MCSFSLKHGCKILYDLISIWIQSHTLILVTRNRAKRMWVELSSACLCRPQFSFHLAWYNPSEPNGEVERTPESYISAGYFSYWCRHNWTCNSFITSDDEFVGKNLAWFFDPGLNLQISKQVKETAHLQADHP